MARELDFENLSSDDLHYLRQRSWLVQEAELLGVEGIRDLVANFDPDAEDEEDETPLYSAAKVEQLRAELSNRGLDTTGKKEDLIARLEADDEADDEDEEEDE